MHSNVTHSPVSEAKCPDTSSCSCLLQHFFVPLPKATTTAVFAHVPPTDSRFATADCSTYVFWNTQISELKWLRFAFRYCFAYRSTGVVLLPRKTHWLLPVTKQQYLREESTKVKANRSLVHHPKLGQKRRLSSLSLSSIAVAETKNRKLVFQSVTLCEKLFHSTIVSELSRDCISTNRESFNLPHWRRAWFRNWKARKAAQVQPVRVDVSSHRVRLSKDTSSLSCPNTYVTAFWIVRNKYS